MVEFEFKRLDIDDDEIIQSFSCLETENEYIKGNSKQKKRIKELTLEIDDFLKTEALNEQEKSMSVTWLMINVENNDLIGYVSLCDDSLSLTNEECREYECTHEIVPCMKIARLAVSNTYQGNNFGKILILLAVNIANDIRMYTGLKFITLDCYKHRLSFYEKYGFQVNTNQKHEMEHLPKSLFIDIDEFLEKYSSDMLENSTII